MMRKYFQLILLLFFLATISTKLTYVATVLRHGARYPVSDKYDGNQTAQYKGQLSTVGMRQEYLLGTYLRSEYIDKAKLINSTLYPKEVQVFSDSSERCVQSTICHLMGLFPFGTGATIPDGISQEMLDPPFESIIKNSLRKQKFTSQFGLEKGYQPVPVKNATQFFPQCPNFDTLMSKRQRQVAQQLAKLQLEQAAFCDKMRITFNLPLNESDIYGLFDLYKVVISDLYLGRPLPSAFTDEDYRQLKYVYDYLYALENGGDIAKIMSTFLMNGILNNMDNIIKKGVNQVMKYSVYNAHKTNLIPFVMFLNLTTPQCIEKQYKNYTVSGNCAEIPPFATNIIFQLHQNDASASDFYVKIRYNGYYLNSCGDKVQCPYPEFASRMRSQFVDVVKECGIKGDLKDFYRNKQQ